LHEVLARARSRFGGAPLGYLAADETSALEALRHGADEAMATPLPSEQAIHGFVDRTVLRAVLRREQDELRANVVHAEKLAALGTLVAGVAHEVNNPLTALQLCIEACRALLGPGLNVSGELRRLADRGSGASADEMARLATIARTGAPPREGAELLDEMRLASQAIADIVRDLRIFARADERGEQEEIVNVADLVDQALRLTSRDLGSVAQVERDYARDLPRVLVPPGRLSQVLINVLVNAAHAIHDVERPAHRIRVATRADDEHVAISISDTGPGIPSETLDHIFDPFFTTKRVGTGTGLGLSISRAIMRELGGDLIVESVHGDGATFIALIPLADSERLFEAMRRSSAPVMPPKHLQRSSVLFVDDDSAVLRAYCRVLGKKCNVLLASDGQDAIDLLSTGSAPDAIGTELAWPDLDGQGLYSWLCRERPQLARRTVFVTADATSIRYQTFVSELENPVLLKPVNASTLMEAINGVVDRP
jgi:signal transduction histidine kinase